MFDFLTHLFDASGFPPRWHCGAWTAGHGWLHILSDLGVWSAYVAIPCVLGYFVVRKKDVPFRTIFWLFGAFILACGTTHLMEVIIFWWPVYRLAGVIKLFTALVSWGTVMALVPVTPKALAMRGPEELDREIAARRQAEDALQQANTDLELRVEQRTADLARANQALQAEIEERKHIEMELREQREQLRITLASIGDGVIVTDAEGRVTSLNPVAQAVTGWGEQALGKPLEEVFTIINEQTHEAVENPVARVLREGVVVGLANHTMLIAKDTTERPIDDSAAPIRDQQGNVVGVVLVFRDVTERRRADQARSRDEAALRDTTERLRSVVNHVLDAIISMDEQGTVETFNPAAERIFGYAAVDVIGQNVKMLMPEPFHGEHDSYLASYLRTGQAKIIGIGREVIGRRKDGSTFPMDLAVSEFHLAKRRCFTGIVRDITDRKAAEQQSQKNQEILKLVHRIGQIGHWEWNSLTDENNWSPEIEALYGLPPGGFVGSYEGWTKLLHPDDLAKAEEDVRRAFETGEYFTDFRVVWPDGSIHWLETRAHVFKDSQDRPVRIMGVNMDVTERKRIEEELRTSRKELQHRAEQLAEADRRKDEFLAMLAHELRNPLAPIRNALQIMKQPGAQGSLVDSVRDMMERQVQHMTRMVDDLLDVSRITRGKIELRKEVVDLAMVVKRAVETIGPLIADRRQELTVTLAPEPMRLEADPTRLEQVLANLLNNAVKYTDHGGRIQLTAQLENDEIVLRVKDSGIGISGEMLSRIFEPFVQSDRLPYHSAQGGLGIGLTLVRSLVEMHRGTVRAHSDGPGEGSEFVVRLPALSPKGQGGSAEIAEKGPQPVGTIPKRTILVVDDNVDAAESLALLLRLQGHDVRVAHDGPAALAAVDAGPPDLVFLDIGMPVMNGYEVAQRLRQSPGLVHLVLVALTGWGQEEDRRRSQEAGFNHHLVKPVDPEALRQLLANPRQ